MNKTSISVTKKKKSIVLVTEGPEHFMSERPALDGDKRRIWVKIRL